MVEHEPEDDADGEGGAGQTHEHPQDGRVVRGRRQGLGDGGAEGVGEEVHRLHKRLHRRRRLGVGVFQTGHRGENLRQTDEHVGGRLDGNVHLVAGSDPIDDGGIAAGVFIAGAGGVDQVLHDRGVHHGQGGDDEAQGDTRDGAEGDAQTAQQGVDQGLQDGDEHDDGDGVKVLHQVVGNAVALHLTGLGDKVARELTIHDPVDRVEAEDTAGDESALELVDEMVVPRHGAVATVGGLPGGLGGIHVAVDDHDPQGLERVGDDGSLRRAHNVELASEHEHQGTTREHAQTEQVAGPEADVALHVRRGQQRERSQVNTTVEDHVDTLDGERRVDDDALSLLRGRDSHLLPLVLVRNQRSNVTLDTTGSQTDNQDGDDEASQTSAVLESRRDGCADQDEQTDHVDDREQHDGLVFAQVLISDNGTNDGSH